MEDEITEAKERHEVEIEYITSAYGKSEAWVERISNVSQKNTTSPTIEIHRKINLAPTNEAIELILIMTNEYLVKEDSKLLINALLTDENKSNPSYRRKALNAIPSLLQACREEAEVCSGQESVFAILHKADEWIDTEWQSLLHTNEEKTNEENLDNPTKKERYILERRVIYSHHIIASSKRRAISDLSKHYNLGGYYKIGWPGIIILEGLQDNCQMFYDEIKTMRWQYLVQRGCQTFTFDSLSDLEGNFVFERGMLELGGDDMSILGKKCQDVGLHDLFMTAFKKYAETDNVDSSEVVESYSYGALILLDHMNNSQIYHTFLQNVTKEANCTFARLNYKTHQRNRIIILLIGLTEIGVKQVLKQWRISKVDVDKKGKACKERMMTVLMEGDVLRASEDVDLEDLEECYDDSSVIEKIVYYVGGEEWLKAMQI